MLDFRVCNGILYIKTEMVSQLTGAIYEGWEPITSEEGCGGREMFLLRVMQVVGNLMEES